MSRPRRRCSSTEKRVVRKYIDIRCSSLGVQQFFFRNIVYEGNFVFETSFGSEEVRKIYFVRSSNDCAAAVVFLNRGYYAQCIHTLMCVQKAVTICAALGDFLIARPYICGIKPVIKTGDKII